MVYKLMQDEGEGGGAILFRSVLELRDLKFLPTGEMGTKFILSSFLKLHSFEKG